ncbi:hypothetical protein HK100_010557, partial [Physocladia obscura]
MGGQNSKDGNAARGIRNSLTIGRRRKTVTNLGNDQVATQETQETQETQNQENVIPVQKLAANVAEPEPEPEQIQLQLQLQPHHPVPVVESSTEKEPSLSQLETPNSVKAAVPLAKVETLSLPKMSTTPLPAVTDQFVIAGTLIAKPPPPVRNILISNAHTYNNYNNNSEIKLNVVLLERSVTSAEPRFAVRALRASATLRPRLSFAVLAKAAATILPKDTVFHGKLSKYLSTGEMEVDVPAASTEVKQ